MDAKRHFSKQNCAAKNLSEKYIKGTPNRQDLLEKALKGICAYKGIKDITSYMAEHRNDKDADELWQYFQDVINWVKKIFQNYYPDMKDLDWCKFYNIYHKNTYNSSDISKDVKRLHEDEDVGNNKGIYEYLLSKDFDPFAETHLNIREFSERDKLSAYSKQDGKCVICKKVFEYAEMEGDHIIPWSKGGETILENLQALCSKSNFGKSDLS